MPKAPRNSEKQSENMPKGPPPEIKLPFEKKKAEPGEWIYERRASIFITVIIYLVLAILSVFSRIVFEHSRVHNEIVVDLTDMEELRRELEQAEELNRLLSDNSRADTYEQIRNVVSNENARVEELEQSDRQLQDQLRESREMFERGNDEIRLMEEAERLREEETAGEDTKKKGDVTVSFSLRNPLRTAVNLYVPAYKCQGGGRIVVDVSVTPSGEVLKARVRSASSSDRCMSETAVDAALRSRFNANPSAPDPQKGTITYIFIPQ